MTDQMEHTIDDVVAKTHRQDVYLFALLAIIVLLAVGFVWQAWENSGQNLLIRQIEALSEQQVCADKVEVAYEAAIARVVLAAIGGDDAAVAVTHAGLTAALVDLDRIDELCPPVTARSASERP